MAEVYSFTLDKEDSLITLDGEVENYSVTLIFDTGSTNTIIDWNILQVVNQKLIELPEKKNFETAGGVISASTFLINHLHVLNHDFFNIKIYSYDFFKLGIISEYDGMLGLDLLKSFSIHLNFPNSQIKIL